MLFPHVVSKWRKNKWCDNQIQTHFALKCICLGSINKWVPIARNMMKKMVCFITWVLCFLDCFFDASDICVYMITIGKFMSINTPSHLCTSKLVFLGSTGRKALDLISLSLPLSLFLVRPNWVKGLMPIGYDKKILRSTFLLCCFAIKKKKKSQFCFHVSIHHIALQIGSKSILLQVRTLLGCCFSFAMTFILTFFPSSLILFLLTLCVNFQKRAKVLNCNTSCSH